MPYKMLKLSPQLRLPAAELACEVVASLGIRGSGKTNGAVLIVEQLCDAGIPVVVLDYVGIWFGLRLGRDGKSPSRYAVPVLGGRHGDIALSPTSGAVVAEALAERHSAAVLDVSLFSKSDRCRFAADFAEAFFRAKKKHPGPVQLVLEEAQRFVPQFVPRGLERMLGAFEEIAEVGRNFGIGLMLISQRPQKLHKDVLNLADTVIAYRMLGSHERKAVAEWVREKGAPERADVADELPGLPTGTAVVWCPSRQLYGKFAVNMKSTYDAGATPLTVRASVETKPLDLKVLEAAMGKAAEEARASDPRELSLRLRRCEGDLAVAVEARKKLEARAVALQRELDLARRVSVQEVKLDVVPAKMAKVLEGAVAELRSAWSALGKSMTKLDECVHSSRALAPSCKPTTDRATASERRPAGDSVARDMTEVDDRLSLGERRVLAAAAQSDLGVTREYLTVLTGYKRSSRDTFLQKLRSRGLVELRSDRIYATTAGFDLLGPSFERLPTGSALLEYWRGRLSTGEVAVLDLAAAAYPGEVSKDAVLESTPYKRSSLDTFIQRLRARELVSVDGDAIRAAGALFDD